MKLCLIGTLLVGFVGGITAQVVTFQQKCPDVKVQKDFDVVKYMGKWYEMERYFAIFQMLTHCVTAEYTLGADGIVIVNNTGYSSLSRNTVSTAIGSAVQDDPNEPAKLGVGFSENVPRGNYWVLSTDYTSYSLVWSCDEEASQFFTANTQFLWILTRKQEGISHSKQAELYKMAEDYGIDPRKLTRFSHTDCPAH